MSKAVEQGLQGVWTKWDMPKCKMSCAELWGLDSVHISFLLQSVYDTLPAAKGHIDTHTAHLKLMGGIHITMIRLFCHLLMYYSGRDVRKGIIFRGRQAFLKGKIKAHSTANITMYET